jgi:hypothetical protein
MAILSESKSVDGGHWYRPDGTPCHQLPKKDGSGLKSTTLADAKKLSLLPSVTGYTSIVDKPALLNWKATQVALAAFENPPQEDETVEYFCERVIGASKSETVAAQIIGTQVHKALEALLTDGPSAVPEGMWPYVSPVMEWKQKNKITYDAIEVVLVNHEHGYAGTCDALAHDADGNKLVIDYKTKKTKAGQKITPYDTQGMQLAAYAVAKWGEDALHSVHGYNVYISSTQVGRVEAYKHDSLVPHWEAFKAACILWRHVKGYDPRQPAFSTLKEAA